MLRRLLLWAVLTGAGLTAVTFYLGKIQDGGSPLARIHERSPAAPEPAPGRDGAATTVYRWRDAAGTVHYESQPPPPGVKAEVLRMRRGAPAPAPVAPVAAGVPETPDEIMRQLETTLDALGQRQRTLDSLDRKP